jgi:hypothetical protein
LSRRDGRSNRRLAGVAYGATESGGKLYAVLSLLIITEVTRSVSGAAFFPGTEEYTGGRMNDTYSSQQLGKQSVQGSGMKEEGRAGWYAHSTPEPDIAPTPDKEPVPQEVPVVDPQPNEVPQTDPIPIQDPIPHQMPVST